MTTDYERGVREGMRRAAAASGAGGDRAELLYLAQQNETDILECENCGAETAMSITDNAYHLRDYLAANPSPAPAEPRGRPTVGADVAEADRVAAVIEADRRYRWIAPGLNSADRWAAFQAGAKWQRDRALSRPADGAAS